MTTLVSLLLALSFLSGCGVILGQPVPGDTLINQVPFIMTHDTAMGYLGEDDIYANRDDPDELLIAWAKTQIGTVTDQINCGARAFDMRPYLTQSDGLRMHHGGVIAPYLFKDSMQEMVTWAAENPDDILIAEVSKCSGDTLELKEECTNKTKEALEELSIAYIDDEECISSAPLQGMTLDMAKEKGKLPGGGSILAVWGKCWVSNYDVRNSCSGYEFESTGVSRKYNCWANLTNPDYPMSRIFNYLDATWQAGPPANGSFWQMQSLWQISEGSVSLGGAQGSSILTDILHSRLNYYLFGNLTEGRWSSSGVNGVNMFEVDHVCDQGSRIFLALDPSRNVSLEDYPDDVVILDTGIHNSIIAGDSVLFPDVPDDFKARTFSDTVAIRRNHNGIRFGKTNDIFDLVASGDEDKQNDYLIGVLAAFIIMAIIWVFWACLLIYFKLSKRLVWFAGDIPRDAKFSAHVSKSGQSNENEADLPELEEEAKKPWYKRCLCNCNPGVETRLKRIRVAVMLSGFLLLVFSGLLIGLGFKGVADTLDSTEESLPKLRELIATANTAANAFVIQSNQTTEARINFVNAVANNCNVTGNALGNVSGIDVNNAFKGNGTDDLIALNDTLNNNTFFVPEAMAINRSLAKLHQDFLSVEDTVDDISTSVLFPIAVAFVLLVDVMTIIFMYGVYLAWKRQTPRLFNDCSSKVALPLYIFFIFIAYLMSAIATTGATLAADFCYDTPDNQVLRVIEDMEPPFDEFIAYYVRGCGKDIKPEILFDAFKVLEYVILSIYDLITDLKNVDRELVDCNNTDMVFGTIDVLQEEYNAYVDGLYQLAQAMNCDKINPIYTGIAYSTTCINGFESMSEIFGYMLAMSLCAMTIITLRVAFYDVEESLDEDRAGLDEKGHDEEDALEEGGGGQERAQEDDAMMVESCPAGDDEPVDNDAALDNAAAAEDPVQHVVVAQSQELS